MPSSTSIVLGLIAGMTYALMSEGLWGAALMFFNALFAALIAFNFYEPLAQLIVDNVRSVGEFRRLAEPDDPVHRGPAAAPAGDGEPRAVDGPVPDAGLPPGPGRLRAGRCVVVVAMLLLGYQASPVQKKMLGVMDFKYQPMYKERFDRDFLAFFQYTTGYTFARNGVGEVDPPASSPPARCSSTPRPSG